MSTTRLLVQYCCNLYDYFTGNPKSTSKLNAKLYFTYYKEAINYHIFQNHEDSWGQKLFSVNEKIQVCQVWLIPCLDFLKLKSRISFQVQHTVHASKFSWYKLSFDAKANANTQ